MRPPKSTRPPRHTHHPGYAPSPISHHLSASLPPRTSSFFVLSCLPPAPLTPREPAQLHLLPPRPRNSLYFGACSLAGSSFAAPSPALPRIPTSLFPPILLPRLEASLAPRVVPSQLRALAASTE